MQRATLELTSPGGWRCRARRLTPLICTAGRGLAGGEIDAVQPVAGHQPGFVLALAVRPDVERHRVDLDAELADRVEHAVVRRRLLDQRADRGVDVVERGFLGALHRVGVGAGDDVRLLALVHVGVGELVRAVLRDLAVVDVDAEVGAVVAHHAQPVGHRVEVDGRQVVGQLVVGLVQLRLHGRLAGLHVDRVDAAVGADAHTACRRPDARRCRAPCRRRPRSSRSWSRPSCWCRRSRWCCRPYSAATSAACAAAALMQKRPPTRPEWYGICMDTLPWIRSRPIATTGGTGRRRRLDAGPPIKEM